MSAACMGIMLGLDGIEAGADFRGPIADRMLISSADGGFSINDAVRMAYYLAGLGSRLAGGEVMAAPKDGAQFHFSLPGSRQGFRARSGPGLNEPTIANVESDGLARASRQLPGAGPRTGLRRYYADLLPAGDAGHEDLRPDGDAVGLSGPDCAGAGGRRPPATRVRSQHRLRLRVYNAARRARGCRRSGDRA